MRSRHVGHHVRCRETVFLHPPDVEIERTAGVTALLDRWFPAASPLPGALPACLLSQLGAATRLHPRPLGPLAFARDGVGLRVTIAPLFPRSPEHRWGIVLEETAPARRRSTTRFAALTDREREVVGWIARGRTVAGVASALRCRTTTVKTHLHHVYAKLGISGRQALLEMWRGGG